MLVELVSKYFIQIHTYTYTLSYPKDGDVEHATYS